MNVAFPNPTNPRRFEIVSQTTMEPRSSSRVYPKFRRESSSPFRRRSGSRLEWWGISIRGVRRVHPSGVAWSGGTDRRIERDRWDREGREQRVRKGWRGERPLGSRTAIETHRACRVFLFFLFLSLSLSLSSPSSSGSAVTDPFSRAMVVSGEFVNRYWDNSRKCTNM